MTHPGAVAPDLIEPLVEFAQTTPSASIPRPVLEATSVLISDALTIGLAGHLADGVPELLASLARHTGGGNARVIGRIERLPPAAAALANTALIHALEFDPVADAWLLHPMAGSLPAALALTEQVGSISGLDFLASVAIGTEVACRIASAATSAPIFYRPGSMSTFAATAAAVRLLGLGPRATRHAFGIAFSLDGGTSYQAHEEGASVHATLPGFCVRAAIEAVWLAAEGIQGPERVLEGRNGYYHLFEGGAWERERALRGLGEEWLARQVSLKPFPTGRLCHGAIAGVLELRDQLGLTPESVRRLVVYGSRHVVARTGRVPAAEAGALHQKLSTPFAAAQALIHGRVGLRQFGPGLAADPTVRDLLGRIAVELDPNLPPQALAPTRLRLETADGSVVEHVVEDLPGGPGRPLTRQERLAKARDVWESTGRPAWWSPERLAETVERLEQEPDLSGLWRALTPA